MCGPYVGLLGLVRQQYPLPFLNALMDSEQYHRAVRPHIQHRLHSGHREASYEEHAATDDARGAAESWRGN